MITLLTGSPGHGKSYTLIREIEEAVTKGKPVATNVPLHEDWPLIMARRHTLFGPFRKNAVIKKAVEFSKMVIVSDDFEELLRVRLAGEGESRGKMILDESQRWLNTRGFDNALTKDGKVMPRALALAARMKILNHLSGHRHYGYDVILATQSDKSLDSQARDLYEFHSEVRNMKKLPWIGFFCRMNMFLRITKWNDRARSKAGVSVYFLSKSLAGLYHTHALQEKDWPADVIMLPHGSEIPENKIRLATLGIEEAAARLWKANEPEDNPQRVDPMVVGVVYRLSTGHLITVKTNTESKEPKILPPPTVDDEVRSQYMN
jgi:hypothetical protein